jgi:hypothetical protein
MSTADTDHLKRRIMDAAETVATGVLCRLWQELQYENGDEEMGLTLNVTSKRGTFSRCLPRIRVSFVFLAFHNSEASILQRNFTENASSTHI